MVLGPPRSGKTSSIVIPAMLAAPGAAVSTATKRDVLEATWRARAEIGQVWLFDPTGSRTSCHGRSAVCRGRRSALPGRGTAR
jgi:type IV secretory pathway TraG/TraD family ATPase VirD4